MIGRLSSRPGELRGCRFPFELLPKESKRGYLAERKPPLKFFAKRSPEMASLIMAAEPLVVPVAAAVVG